jgi:PAS domain S-box-containing protein
LSTPNQAKTFMKLFQKITLIGISFFAIALAAGKFDFHSIEKKPSKKVAIYNSKQNNSFVEAPSPFITVGLYENSPKIFTDATGNPSGIFPEILKAIALQEQWNLTFIPCNWSQCLDMLLAGKIDIMPDVAFTPERAEIFEFPVEEVMGSWSVLYGRKGVYIESIAELDNKRIAVVKGSVQENILHNIINGFSFQTEIIHFDSFEDAFHATSIGSSDLAAASFFTGDFDYKTYRLIKTPVVFGYSSLHFVTAKEKNTHLLEVISAHLKQMKRESGSPYYQTLGKWMPPTVYPTWPTFLKPLFISIAILLSALMLFIYTLRWQVRQSLQKQRLTSEMLQASEDLRKKVFEYSRTPIVVMDCKSYRYIDCNPAATQIYGFQHKEEVIGKRPIDVSAPRQYKGEVSAELTLTYIQEARKNGSVVFEWLHRRPNGDFWDAEVHLLHFNVANQDYLQFSLIDITERKKNEQALIEKYEHILEQYNHLEQDFDSLSRNLHPPIMRLENSVANLSSHIRSLQQGLTETVFPVNLFRGIVSERIPSVIQQVQFQSEELTRFMHVLVELTHLSTTPLELKYLDLESILQKIKSELLSHLQLQGIRLEISAIPECYGDAYQLEKLWKHLINNAIQFRSPMRPLVIRISGIQSADKCYLRIEDNGLGIPLTEQEKIWHMFYRTPEGKECHPQGLGIGLSIVKKITQLHRGSVRVESVREQGGLGSIFHVELPMHPVE